MKPSTGRSLAAALIALGVFLSSCSPPENAGELRLGTASLGGAYYPLGQSFSNVVNKYAEGVSMVPVVTAGSPHNPRLLANGDIEAGLTNADLAWFAVNGEHPYDKPLNIKSLGVLHASVLHLITLADSEINEFEDIRGKRIAVGPVNGGTLAFLDMLLREYNMTMADIKPSYLSYTDGFSQLGDGNVDASFALSGLPGAAISQLTASHSIKHIAIKPTMMSKILADYPYYKSVTIEKELYKTSSAGTALGVNNLLIVRDDMPEQTGFEITRAIYDHLDELSASNASAKHIDRAMITSSSIDLHPGATRYFSSPLE